MPVPVLPFLNSNGVDVRPVQTILGINRDWIRVHGCFPHRVILNVLVAPGFVSLEKLVSKEQVFPQCTDWLGKWSLSLEATASTSAALVDLLVADADTRRKTGAICNLLAHDLYGGRVLFKHIENAGNTTLFLVASAQSMPPWDENLLVCLTCPTEDCYKSASNDFAAAGFPIKFSSLKGEFTAAIPFFLQLANLGNREELAVALQKPHRHLLGTFSTKHSLSSCVGGFFEHDYLDEEI